MPATRDPLELDPTLHCPHCGYNLTGLPENRCPECGMVFDPDVLASNSPRPAVPWDSPDQCASLAGFWKTWCMAARTPAELAAKFPNRHKRGPAIAYSLICYGGALFIIMASAIVKILIDPANASEVIKFAAYSSLPTIVVFWSCEVALSLALKFASPPSAPLNTLHFWRGLMHYCSGFSLLTAAWAALFLTNILSPDLPLPVKFAISTILPISALAIWAWWAVACCSMIRARFPPTGRRIIACVACAIIGAIAAICGFYLAALSCYLMLRNT